MLLEKYVSNEEIRKVFAEQKIAEEQFFKEFPKLFPSEDPKKEIEETKKLNKLLKKNVLTSLIQESKKISTKKVKTDDLILIIDYAMATMNSLDVVGILSHNYCNGCGKCCVLTSPIVITPEEYVYMTNSDPDLFLDIEADLDRGGFKFIEDKPCKFYDETNKKCKIYDLRPEVCRTYPVSGGGIVGAGDCEYMVRYVFEKSKNILLKCIT